MNLIASNGDVGLGLFAVNLHANTRISLDHSRMPSVALLSLVRTSYLPLNQPLTNSISQPI